MLYNTETAEILGRRESERSSGRLLETLYQSRTGHYFLHGEIMPASARVIAKKGGRSAGRNFILPLTPALAARWAHRNLPAAESGAPIPYTDPDE